MQENNRELELYRLKIEHDFQTHYEEKEKKCN
jgi:hypothetical protein